ncbi:jg11408 [Pararge aegeria aegeria]|uniref:Jg11408 protein n=1 Tax=Pararge aegeria aegeria TaxID=348720 RepID=A0A8S4QA54_9NEOP|nr:jg11408 [Pararge aegeria aegeria]
MYIEVKTDEAKGIEMEGTLSFLDEEALAVLRINNVNGRPRSPSTITGSEEDLPIVMVERITIAPVHGLKAPPNRRFCP